MSFFGFFFQAEDGIRDLVRSRGLGDVYKRQGKGCGARPRHATIDDADPPGSSACRAIDVDIVMPVSYTHLTLPTSDLV